LLALGTWFSERRLAARFPLALDEPYFARLTRQVGREPARVRIVPYSYQLPPQAVLGLQAIAVRVLGPNVEISAAANVVWGGEDALPGDLLPAGPLALVAVIFPLAATPEPENHGAFVGAVAAQTAPGTPLVAIIDESYFRKRFAQQSRRLEERRAAWRKLLATRRLEPVFVDLEAPDLAAAAAAVERSLRVDVEP
jgi:hypothetical protein